MQCDSVGDMKSKIVFISSSNEQQQKITPVTLFAVKENNTPVHCSASDQNFYFSSFGIHTSNLLFFKIESNQLRTKIKKKKTTITLSAL